MDSGEDIARSVNELLEASTRPALPHSRIRSYVGDGVRRLLERSLGEASDAELARAEALYLSIYRRRLLETTRPYPGVVPALEILRRERSARGSDQQAGRREPHDPRRSRPEAVFPDGVRRRFVRAQEARPDGREVPPGGGGSGRRGDASRRGFDGRLFRPPETRESARASSATEWVHGTRRRSNPTSSSTTCASSRPSSIVARENLRDSRASTAEARSHISPSGNGVLPLGSASPPSLRAALPPDGGGRPVGRSAPGDRAAPAGMAGRLLRNTRRSTTSRPSGRWRLTSGCRMGCSTSPFKVSSASGSCPRRARSARREGFIACARFHPHPSIGSRTVWRPRSSPTVCGRSGGSSRKRAARRAEGALSGERLAFDVLVNRISSLVDVPADGKQVLLEQDDLLAARRGARGARGGCAALLANDRRLSTAGTRRSQRKLSSLLPGAPGCYSLYCLSLTLRVIRAIDSDRRRRRDRSPDFPRRARSGSLRGDHLVQLHRGEREPGPRRSSTSL